MTDEEPSTENVTIVTETFNNRAPTATVSSLKSEDSTEQLISKSLQKKTCKPPQKKTSTKIKDVKKEKSVSCKSVESNSGVVDNRKSKVVVLLGLTQVVLGALLVGAGAFAVVNGAALSRVGAGLWAGCIAVVTGVVGVVAGINDFYGLRGKNDSGSGLLNAFLALSLLCLACGNCAAVLAATGLQKDSQQSVSTDGISFQDEIQAWTPVLTNIVLLIIAIIHCIISIVSICHISKRVCSCLRPKKHYDHNQFDPTFKQVQQFVVIDEKKLMETEKSKSHELCKELEMKLQGGSLKKKKKVEGPEYGSANSKEKLVTHWLGRQPGTLVTSALGGSMPRVRRGEKGVRKPRKPHHPTVVLLPAASTLGRRMPISVMPPPPRYATLPLPPATYLHMPQHPPPHIYYPVHDTRVRRRRSPRESRGERRRRDQGRERNSQLTRSLERIHRKRRTERERMTDADLKRTYTGLDRAYAEQFIAVCDESRHAAERQDSLGSTTDTTYSSHRDSF